MAISSEGLLETARIFAYTLDLEQQSRYHIQILRKQRAIFLGSSRDFDQEDLAGSYKDESEAADIRRIVEHYLWDLSE